MSEKIEEIIIEGQKFVPAASRKRINHFNANITLDIQEILQGVSNDPDLEEEVIEFFFYWFKFAIKKCIGSKKLKNLSLEAENEGY